MSEGPVLLAFSGGLDTSWCVVHLAHTLGRRVVTAVVDTGGFDDETRAELEVRSRELGAERHIHIDGREQVFDRFVRYFIAGNCLRGGVYPLCVAAERVVQAEEIARVAREIGAAAVATAAPGRATTRCASMWLWRCCSPTWRCWPRCASSRRRGRSSTPS